MSNPEIVEILDMGLPGPQGPPVTVTKSISMDNPTSSEDVAMLFTAEEITLSRIDAILRGSGSPSVTFSIKFGPDRTTGTEVKVGGIIVTSTTVGLSTTVLDNATVPANSWVWITTSAKSGTVTELHVSLTY